MEEHPNIDSLRAFAADQLDKDDRRRVLEHLIQCVDCRESLALITPEEGPPVPGATSKDSSGPKLRFPWSRKSSG